MAKLFALEEMDESGVEIELETTPEVGEVADVQVDMAEDMGGVEDQSEAITEGVEAADQLGEVEDVVAAAAEGEGLDPVAAEAIRIAVEAICSRIGANPKAIYSLYATENFQSASSRKANSKIALEGVGEFLKDLWKKIKAALTNLWTKVKAFWDKHFSSLGRAKNALESAKAKIAKSSGKMTKQGYMEKAPSSLASAFPVKGDLLPGTVTKYIDAHNTAAGTASEVIDSATKAAEAVATSANKKSAKADTATENADLSAQLSKFAVDKALGSEAAPLVGGVYINYSLKVEEGEIKFEAERNVVENLEVSGMKVATKPEVSAMVNSVLGLINGDIKAKSDAEKTEASFKKTMSEIEKAVNASVTDSATSETAKGLRKDIKNVYKLSTKTATISATRVSMDLKLVGGVLGVVGVSLKHFE